MICSVQLSTKCVGWLEAARLYSSGKGVVLQVWSLSPPRRQARSCYTHYYLIATTCFDLIGATLKTIGLRVCIFTYMLWGSFFINSDEGKILLCLSLRKGEV